MDRNTILKSIFCAVALILVSCSQDELFSAGEEAADDALPEGMYPLHIGSVSLSAGVSDQPQARVSENSDGTGSVFETGDMFYVKFDGPDEVGTYKITESGSIETVKPVYWTEKTGNIIAWYISGSDSEDATRTVDLSDQKNGLVYVMRATKDGATIGDNVSLTFKHQLAKVRVELSGLRASKVTSVSLNDCRTGCSSNQGSVSATSSSTGDIQMHHVEGRTVFEANVLPGESISTITLNGSTECNLSSTITTEAGAMHKISIQVNADGVPTTATVIDASNCTDIKGTGKYVVSGTFNSTITVTGGSPQIYLVDATVSVSSGNAINITGGSPTIHVVGENTLENSKGNSSNWRNSGAGIYVASNNTVYIEGNSRTDDVLIVNGGAGGCGIGGYLTGSSTAQNCGNIVIKNVTIKATGSYNQNNQYSPAIGAAGKGSCGTITIDNATVYAYGVCDAFGYVSTSAIGAGTSNGTNNGSYGTITIRNNSNVYVSRGNSYSDYIGYSGSESKLATGATDATVSNSTVTKLN